MAQIGHVPGIIAVKEQLNLLHERGLVKEWEIPYEHLLTRLSAAVFFLTPSDESGLPEIWETLQTLEPPSYGRNGEKKLSMLAWRLEFKRNMDV